MLIDILITILAVLVFGGGFLYILAFIRYVRSGEYTIDKRLWEITH